MRRAAPTLAWLALGLGPATLPLSAQDPPAEQRLPQEQGGADSQARGVVPGPPEDLTSLFEGALLDAGNGEDFKETEGYRRLLETIQAVPIEEIRARIVGDLDVLAALADPDAWRGKFVRVRGIYVGVELQRLTRPAGGKRDVWRGAVSEADASEGVLFDMLAEPPPKEALERHRTLVDVEGLFYRVLRFQNDDGEWKEAPYVLARTLAPVDLATVATSTAFDTDTAILILLIVAVLFLVGRILTSMRRARVERERGIPQPTDLHHMLQVRRATARRGARNALGPKHSESPPSGPTSPTTP
jgi:hypothetical protein